MSAHQHASPGASAGGRASTPSMKLVATLSVFGAIAGLLIVLVFQYTQPLILRNQAEATQQAVEQVLAGGVRYQTLFVHDEQLVEQVPAGVDTVKLDKVYTGYDAADQRLGYALVGAQPGFADVVKLIFGYDAASRQVLGMLVIENKETPGLGDKIVKDSAFVNGFTRVATPLRGVKLGAGAGQPDEVDMITGATISSRVVIKIINDQLERYQPLIDAYEKAGGA